MRKLYGGDVFGSHFKRLRKLLGGNISGNHWGFQLSIVSGRNDVDLGWSFDVKQLRGVLGWHVLFPCSFFCVRFMQCWKFFIQYGGDGVCGLWLWPVLVIDGFNDVFILRRWSVRAFGRCLRGMRTRLLLRFRRTQLHRMRCRQFLHLCREHSLQLRQLVFFACYCLHWLRWGLIFRTRIDLIDGLHNLWRGSIRSVG